MITAKKLCFSVALLVIALTASIGVARASKESADKSEIERGKYLVENVAMCVECHTPRNANGELDRNAWL
jgi:mono/diheme cytochrome c family protein